MICQIHSLRSFVLYVKQLQEVARDVWEALAPVIGANLSNFKLLDDKKCPSTPVRMKSVTPRTHGKSPCVPVPLVWETKNGESSCEEEDGHEAPKNKTKKDSPAPEDIKYDQPHVRLDRVKLVQHSKK